MIIPFLLGIRRLFNMSKIISVALMVIIPLLFGAVMVPLLELIDSLRKRKNLDR